MSDLTFDEYQQMAWGTAVYPRRGKNWVYPFLGMVGETGEQAEKLKKLIRDTDLLSRVENAHLEDPSLLTDEEKEPLKKELGDKLWYFSALCCELGFSLSDVAQENIDKLHSRMARGKLKGSGDDR